VKPTSWNHSFIPEILKFTCFQRNFEIMLKKCIALLSLACGVLAFAGRADADSTLVLTGSYNGGISVVADGNGVGLGGGALNGATLDGNALPNVYCVQAFTDINVPGTYSAVVTTDGKIHGVDIPNAGGIAWLIKNIAPAIGSDFVAQSALQAVIWHLSSPAFGHTIDPDTSAAYYTSGDYSTYLLDATTKSVADNNVLWISPYAGSTDLQGLVAAPVPVPSNIILLGLGIVSFCGIAWMKRRLPKAFAA
jgi:hypothetical protein